MNNKIWLGIAILAVGLVVLPQTLSMFAGQHDFYDVSPEGNQVPCLKCHADIYTELSQSGNTNAAHKIIGCEGCHITSAQSNNIHAASTVECVSCHNSLYKYNHTSSGSCITCHSMPISTPKMDATNIKNVNESHRTFAIGAEQSNLMKGMNEACISCHTHSAVNITWTRPTTIVFDAKMSNSGWIVSNFASDGSVIIKTSG